MEIFFLSMEMIKCSSCGGKSFFPIQKDFEMKDVESLKMPTDCQRNKTSGFDVSPQRHQVSRLNGVTQKYFRF